MQVPCTLFRSSVSKITTKKVLADGVGKRVFEYLKDVHGKSASLRTDIFVGKEFEPIQRARSGNHRDVVSEQHQAERQGE